ncbi:outer membrane receptor for ferrienterochelin and colicins [Halanaerobium saccharolyticum]|uniref:Outer membrane receptor for ferrienterochelin and colicins n=1 Tax=Halanaerobium saccharolyticum TaxID=43595 RepID=A0A4R7Z6F9_9FIRM|nr:TonB-dependent receptor [Halanaerobium saccharolyticum]RAK11100.1 outer membrane receptor for ferrienterochelin and colicins [Halanaerobium saccharolyticum]TDW06951.1 outer membrane receptor for ferrienterochelin and colicins [Halanaerobium saccharolyticum]TDX63716.1 outer membrane receptor for ferrienterochelin and colicins [Halanaerobium saccharolyticum]
MLKKAVLVMLTALLISAVPVSAQVEVMELDEVVVTASRYEESIMETPVSIELIDQDEIEESNAQNVAELISSFPGVQITNYGGPAGSKTISIRGSDSNQVLILIDGQSINTRMIGDVDLSQILLSNVKKVEVLKGPASAVYGANALGGVVNIITKKASDMEGLNLEFGIGSFNTYKTALNYGIILDNLDIMITAETVNSDGFRDNPDNSGLDQYNISTKINYNLNQYNEFIFDIISNNSDKEIPGSINMQSPNANQEDEMKNYRLTYKRNKENYDLKTSIYYNDQETNYKNPDFYVDNTHLKEKIGFELNNTLYYDNNTLTYGLEVNNDELDSSQLPEIYEATNKAIFLENSYTGFNDLKINTGIRYDNNEDYGSETNPRISLLYSVNNNNLFVSYGEAYRAPTFDELYWDELWLEGNPDLVPEKSKNYEIGIKSELSNSKMEAVLFKSKLENEIVGYPNPVYKNIKKTETDGLEFNLSNNITDNLILGYSHTYLDSRNVKTNELLKDQYYNDLSLSYKPENYKLIFNVSHVGGRIDDLENYTVCNLNFIKNIKMIKRDYKIKLTVNNLFDQDYQVVENYPMPGRNFMLNLITKF